MSATITMTLRPEVVPVVRSCLESKRKALTFNLRQYQARLTTLEKRHQMPTATFISRFKAGELSDDRDWFEWEYLFDAYQEVARQLQLLESVKL